MQQGNLVWSFLPFIVIRPIMPRPDYAAMADTPENGRGRTPTTTTRDHSCVPTSSRTAGVPTDSHQLHGTILRRPEKVLHWSGTLISPSSHLLFNVVVLCFVVLCWGLGLGPRNLSQFDYGVISGRGCRVHLPPPPSLIPHTTTPNGTRNHALAISPTSALRMISPNPVRCFFLAPFSSFLSQPNRRMKWFLDEISFDICFYSGDSVFRLNRPAPPSRSLFIIIIILLLLSLLLWDLPALLHIFSPSSKGRFLSHRFRLLDMSYTFKEHRMKQRPKWLFNRWALTSTVCFSPASRAWFDIHTNTFPKIVYEKHANWFSYFRHL